MSDILVTGSTGFVGRTLVPMLQGAGLSVRVATRCLVDPTRGVESVVAGDITAAPDWRPVATGVACIVHLAARAHVLQDAASDPLREFRAANCDATLALARTAVQTGVRRFIFVSTIGVLGDATDGIPFRETTPAAPQTPYARSKWEAEEGLRIIARETGLEVVIVRPPLVHGPGAPGNFARLLALVDRVPMLPFGAVRNRRSYVGIENLCTLLVELVRHPAAAQETFLVADDDACSTAELIEILALARGRRVRSWPVPASALRALGRMIGRGDEIERLTGSLEVDASLVRERLGWRPRVTLRDGLTAMAAAWRPDR